MLPRRRMMLIAAVAAIVAITGCDITTYYGHPDEWSGTTDPQLLSVIEPNGTNFEPGDEMQITWDGTDQPELLTIELAHSGVVIETIATGYPNGIPYTWTIPADFAVSTVAPDEYQIVVRGFHPGQAVGTLELIAYSEPFGMVAPTGQVLADVEVSQRNVTITLTDNGSEIDGDTVDLYINGSLFVAGHVLVGGAGTSFPMDLVPGENVLEIYAVNEGTVVPNTALLQITNVVQGPVAQQWRLSSGETGRLTVTAP